MEAPGISSMPRAHPKHWASSGSTRNTAETTTGEKNLRQMTYPAFPKKPAAIPKTRKLSMTSSLFRKPKQPHTVSKEKTYVLGSRVLATITHTQKQRKL